MRRYIIEDGGGRRVASIMAASAPSALRGVKKHLPRDRHRGLVARKERNENA